MHHDAIRKYTKYENVYSRSNESRKAPAFPRNERVRFVEAGTADVLYPSHLCLRNSFIPTSACSWQTQQESKEWGKGCRKRARLAASDDRKNAVRTREKFQREDSTGMHAAKKRTSA